MCWYDRPNRRVEPTALSWRFAKLVEPATVSFGGVALHRSGGGSRASRYAHALAVLISPC